MCIGHCIKVMERSILKVFIISKRIEREEYYMESPNIPILKKTLRLWLLLSSSHCKKKIISESDGEFSVWLEFLNADCYIISCGDVRK